MPPPLQHRRGSESSTDATEIPPSPALPRKGGEGAFRERETVDPVQPARLQSPAVMCWGERASGGNCHKKKGAPERPGRLY
ncbi:hypothetical protein GCM10007301_06260 [Azorhizobium oxalatiphilum]|uniref:Uncharacterized protein n=1 Tax=Azorhizobium oxalatiphilum TaxID=980631 RepID=A0A917BLY5_9HYPH|nr:hypothetical protein GCM10007301_06260 [Azorhizobium oxalatiphilum]